MSIKDVEVVLSRAMSDTAYADLLFSDVEKAVAGFELTAEEISNLRALTRAEFDKLNSSPEERKSFMRILNHNESGF
jgi:hypothetical protein